MGRRAAVAGVAAITVLVGACASTEPTATSTTPATAGGGWDCGSDCSWESAADDALVADGAPGAAGADEAGTAAARSAEPPSKTTGPPAPVPPDEVERPVVTAGSIDDNAAWEDYLLYRQWFDALPSRPAVLDIRVEGRQIIAVVDGDGRPVPGSAVSVTDAGGAEVARLTTYADGRALFHAPAGEVDPSTQRRASYDVTVTPPSGAGGDAVTQALASETDEHTVVLDGSRAAVPVRLDIAFLLDATGSMSDEIERLKANMVSMATQIAELPGDPDVRFALTVYRDHGDLFVTRTFDFTGDVEAFSEALRDVEADGGGDRPEALEEGLHDVLTGAAWRGDDTRKLVFLVADAPPHVGGEGPAYADDLRAAAAEGVKIFPIASSGLADDAQGEYVFRQLAQQTMGRFVFLTYGADGVSPGDATAHQVAPDAYSTLPLDELVVQLVRDEVAALDG